LSKLQKGPPRDYETIFCSALALTLLEQIFKILLFFWFSDSCTENIRNSGSDEQNLKGLTQGTFLPKICFLGVIVSEKIFKEILMSKAQNWPTWQMPWHNGRNEIYSYLKI
jgi:hypothetical protein